MLKPKLQSFGHLIQRVDSLEKTLVLGKIEGKRRRESKRMGWLDSITKKGMATYSSILAGKIPWMEEPGRLQSMGSQRVGHD